MGEVSQIKMSPLVERSLEAFLEEILMLNQVAVGKKVGDIELEPLKQQP
jgi:hypothetical protein